MAPEASPSTGGCCMDAKPGVGGPGSIATPVGSNGFLATVLSGPTVPAAAARLGAWFAAQWGKPIRVGGKVVVARHADVVEVLHRDLDFRIAPVNETRIDEVDGPFVLGIDRGATLVQERGTLSTRRWRRSIWRRYRLSIAQEAVERFPQPAAKSTSSADMPVRLPLTRPRHCSGSAARTSDLHGCGARHLRACLSESFRRRGGQGARVERCRVMKDWLSAEIARRRASGETAPT